MEINYQHINSCCSAICRTYKKKRLEDTTRNVKLNRETAKYVVKEVLKHYERARVPTILEKTMTDKVEGLKEEYDRLAKLNPERRL